MLIEHCKLREQNLYFGGCDYFGLARDSEVIAALVEATQRWGVSVGASRFTSGNHALHRELESLIAECCGTEDCVLLPSGYLANVAVAEVLAQSTEACLMLRSAHPSFANNPGNIYTFNSENDLLGEVGVLEQRRASYAVFVDSVDPVTGILQPAEKFYQSVTLGMLVVDQSHVFGLSLFKKTPSVAKHIVITSSLSKVIGQHGGFIAASAAFISAVTRSAGAFKYATPLPPALCNSAITAIRLCRSSDRSNSLSRNVGIFTRRANEYFSHSPRGIPVFAVADLHGKPASVVSERLLECGIYVPYLDKYGNTNTGVLRISLSSEHTESEVNRLCDALESV